MLNEIFQMKHYESVKSHVSSKEIFIRGKSKSQGKAIKMLRYLTKLRSRISKFHRAKNCQLWKNNVSPNRGKAKVLRHNGRDTIQDYPSGM